MDAISAYWGRRPVSVVTRITQLLGISGKFLSGLIFDTATGRLRENEVGTGSRPGPCSVGAVSWI